ncbi:hypothetical protein CPB84DRAFT_1851624 [Gymnopilus junonius]|uniref:Uncharacterized protein n=1 Tax=Gymnopilus junonius TaxID=109634 RepID=A0A9P5TIS6_GYMJU|nr:hypothetical protein CPB84DRAFT_1851624 [Gymnopilus junonius]
MSARSESPGSSSRSSATPPPQLIEKKKKKKSESKDKSKKATAPSGSGKNEGVDPNWDYAPPPGATLIEEDKELDAGDFDWDRINDNEDLELWLIRIPDSVKPKYLDNLNVDILHPLKAAALVNCRANTRRSTFGGEEIKGISCLLPCKSKKGRLYPAPKPIARHIVLSAQEVKPTLDPNADSPTVYKNPPRYSYPKEVLKHKFLPYGARPQTAVIPKKQHSKKVDEDMAGASAGEAKPQVTEKKSKAKKRKGELAETADTPATKKPKKSKAV